MSRADRMVLPRNMGPRRFSHLETTVRECFWAALTCSTNRNRSSWARVKSLWLWPKACRDGYLALCQARWRETGSRKDAGTDQVAIGAEVASGGITERSS